ncbi:MAG: response regulator [Deltaproteobacteria bacterium]|jgi:putative two-component system response regulator|nr:response regulator [Deltaproteobacteria bacterium]
MKEILVVDDNVTSLKQIAAFLAGSYGYFLVRSGAEAISTCARECPDIILLDVEMPDMDGFETIRILKDNPTMSHIPVIFLTGNQDNATEAAGLKFGARDFIRKPVEKDILLHRLGLHLDIAGYQAQLENSVQTMTDSLALSISELIECRDENTGGHVARTGKYVKTLGRELLARGSYADELSGLALEMMARAAPLHDIGKIAVSDRILLKPGSLNDEEFAAMKRHAAIGAELLEKMYERTPSQTYLKYAVMIAASHHEKYNGRGYPKGLSGEDIPLCGRIMAVADVYDALVDNRVYRKGMSYTEAFRIITDGRGTQFDPLIVDAFESCHLEFVSAKDSGQRN